MPQRDGRRLRCPIVPLMGYSPSVTKERFLLHVCKGGDVGRVVDVLYSTTAQAGVSVTYAWDNGDDQCLEPLKTLFERAREVHVVSDVSPYGVAALQRV